MNSPRIIFDNRNNYGIMKTEAIVRFGPKHDNLLNINDTQALEWLWLSHSFGRSLSDPPKEMRQRSYKSKEPLERKNHKKKHSKHKLKGKKCIYKLLKKKKKKHFMKKYLIPMVLGLLAAKSLLIPVALKVIALISLKALFLLSTLKLIKT